MKKFFGEWKWILIIGFFLLIFAFGIRLYNLTLLPVFADEAIYIRWSQIMNAESTLRFLPLSDGKQPLFMWILMFFVNRMLDPLFAGRIISVFSGIGTMVGIFGLSYLLFRNKLLSLISVLIWAVCPLSFFFDRMALVDSMLAAFGVWTMFFGVLTTKTRRLDMALITGFFFGLGMLTKSPAIFFFLLLPLTWILIKNPRDLFKLLPLYLVTGIVGYGMYNILRLGPNFNLIASRNLDYVLPISRFWTYPTDPLVPHLVDVFVKWFPKMGPWPIFGLIVLGLLVGWKKYFKEKAIVLLSFFGPLILLAEYGRAFTVRYILFLFPILFILMSSGVLVKNKAVKALFYLFLILFSVTSLVFDYYLLTNPAKANLPRSERSGYLEEWTAGDGIKEVAQFLKTERLNNPEEKIVVGTEGYFGTLPDGLQMYLNDTPEIIVIGVGLDLSEIPKSLMESKDAGNKTYLLINKSRFEGDADKLGLKLIASYLKSPRKDTKSKEYIVKGPQEVLLFFKVQ